MKNKFSTILLTSILLNSSLAMAKESSKESSFKKFQDIEIEALNKNKPLIDNQIACIEKASTKKAVSACGKEKRAAAKKIRDAKKAKVQALKDEAKAAKKSS